MLAAPHAAVLNNAYLLFGIIAGSVAFLGAVVAVGRFAWRSARKIGDFLDDWSGTLPRPGVMRRPGVMERLDVQDDTMTDIQARTVAVEGELKGNSGKMTDIQARMITVEGELKSNSGTSVKDAVHRIEDRVKTIEIYSVQQQHTAGSGRGND